MQNRISLKYQPIKNDAGLKGRDLGKIGIGTRVVVDETLARKDDRKTTWAPIVGPAPMGPLWLETREQGWIELANTALEGVEQHQYLLTVDEAGGIVSCRQIS
jgi:hypothetical protein